VNIDQTSRLVTHLLIASLRSLELFKWRTNCDLNITKSIKFLSGHFSRRFEITENGTAGLLLWNLVTCSKIMRLSVEWCRRTLVYNHNDWKYYRHQKLQVSPAYPIWIANLVNFACSTDFSLWGIAGFACAGESASLGYIHKTYRILLIIWAEARLYKHSWHLLPMALQ